METSHTEGELSVEGLMQQLAGAGIYTTEWGTGQAKTPAHLQEEIKSGETILAKDEQGRLLRTVEVGGADIYYEAPDGKKYRLIEEKQVFKDGRERRRDLGHAVSEKMKPGEDPLEAITRGIREELGIEGELNVTPSGDEVQVIPSPSYPGLQSKYTRHTFVATLTEGQYRPKGYIEEQADKSTFFVWQEIS